MLQIMISIEYTRAQLRFVNGSTDFFAKSSTILIVKIQSMLNHAEFINENYQGSVGPFLFVFGDNMCHYYLDSRYCCPYC